MSPSPLLLTPLLSLLLAPVTPLADPVLLITGGYNGSNFLSDSEVIPTTCMVPRFPGGVISSPHYGHITTLTHDNVILTCGGITNSRKCLALNITNNTWVEHSHLDQSRVSSTSLTMPEGLFLFGDDLYDETTSSFLPTGTTEWQPGPSPPGAGITGACAVAISDSEFLLIGGRYVPDQVVSYSMVTGQWTQWPSLVHGRALVSCVRVGDTVVVGGGEGDTSTSVIHLPSKTVTEGGAMTVARGLYFHMAVLGDRLLAIGGDDGVEYLDSIEEWDSENQVWRETEMRMSTARYSFGLAVAPVAAVCPDKRV